MATSETVSEIGDAIGLLEALPQAAVVVVDGVVVYANQPAAELVGAREPKEVEGQDASAFAHPRFKEPMERYLGRIAGQMPRSPERMVRLDGTPVDVEISALEVEYGDDPAFLVFLDDVTWYKASERSLRDALSLHEATLEATADGILVVDMDGQIASYNQRFQEMWGIPEEVLETGDPEEVLDHGLEKLKDPDGYLEQVRKLYDQPESTYTGLVDLQDGRIFQWHSRPRRRAGEIVGRVASFRDVTSAQRAQQALGQSLERLRGVIDASPEAILAVDPTGKVQLWSRAAERIFGWKASEVVGKPYPLVPEGKQEEYQANLERVLSGKPIHNMELRRQRKDGTVIDVTLSVAPLRDPEGEVAGVMAVIGDNTEPKQLERSLRRTVTLLTATLDATADGILVVDDQGAVIESNRRFQQLWRIPNDVMATGDDAALLEHVLDQVEDPEGFIQRVEELYGSAEIEETQEIRFKDGRVFERSSRPLTVDGQVAGRVWSFRDVTDRHRAEQALRQSEEQFRSLYENAPIGIYRTTPDGEILLANPALLEMLGYASLEELRQRNLEGDLFEPEYSREEFRDLLARTGEVRGLESTWTRMDGEALHVRESAREVHDAEGNVLYYEGTVEDISERIQAEEDMREQRDLYASLLRAQSDLNEGLVIHDTGSGAIVYANDAYCRLTGYSFRELASLDSVLDLVAPADVDQVRGRIEHLASGGEAVHYEGRLVHAGGHEIWVEGAATQVESRGYGLVLGLVRDITARKRAQQELSETAERLEEAQRVGRIGSWELDFQREEAIWSPQMFHLFGFAPQEEPIQLERIFEAIYPEDRERVNATIQRAIESGGRYTLDNRVVLPDGTVRWIHAQGELLGSEDDDGPYLVGTAQDITERKRAEEEARRLTEELEERVEQRTAELRAANEELEAFSYSVSHDLKGPLHTINGFTKIFLDQYGDQVPDEGEDLLVRVREASMQMEDLIEALLTLSRVSRKQLQRREVDLSGTAAGILEGLKDNEPDRKVELSVEQGLTTQGDPRLVEALLTNVLGNAWKFTRDEAVARIRVGLTETDRGQAFYVQDNGVGFEMEQADRLFQPFQRLHTEDRFAGTGIGLATVQRIVARHGGEVWAEGEEGQGATVFFRLQPEVDHGRSG